MIYEYLLHLIIEKKSSNEGGGSKYVPYLVESSGVSISWVSYMKASLLYLVIFKVFEDRDGDFKDISFLL